MALIVVGIAWVAGLAAGAALGGPWWTGGAWTIAAAPALVLAGPLKGRYLLVAACVVAALTAGWRLGSTNEPATSWLEGIEHEVVLTGVVHSEPDRGETTTAYVVSVASVELEGEALPAGGRVLVYLSQYTELLPGDTITVEGSVGEPPVFEGFDYRAYLAQRGISATMFRPRLLKQEGGEPSVGRWLTAQRLRLDRSLQRSLPEPEASLAAGIAFGRDDGLSREAKEQFNRSGLRHLVAVSGSNVSLVVALTYAVAIPTIGRRWAWLPAALTLAAYLGAAGLSASVMRSGIMAGVLLGGSVVGRPQSGLPALFAAIICMTAVAPALAYEAGFQLSATATAGLLTFSPWLSHWLLRATGRPSWLALPHWLCESLALTVAASLATAPVMWVTFDRFSIVSPVANAIVQPAFALAFWASMVTSVLGIVSRDLGEISGTVAYYPLAFITTSAEALGSPRWAAADSPSWGAPAALAAYASLGTAAMAAYRYRPPGGVEPLAVTRSRARWSRFSIGGAIGVTAVAVIPISILPQGGPGALVVTFLDVGQGDAALVTTPNGRQILIDGGPSGTELARELGQVMPHWDRTIDAVIATHPQEDHIAGLPAAYARFRVGNAYGNGRTNATASYQALAAQAPGAGLLGQGDVLEFDGVRFEVLWPPAGFIAEELNDTSLVIRVTYRNRSILFTGDSEEPVHAALRDSGDLPADVLKVPHHGSKTTASWFFAAVHPAIAVISVGEANIYGHPHVDTLSALQGASLYRTDTDGRVTLQTDGTTIRVWTER